MVYLLGPDFHWEHGLSRIGPGQYTHVCSMQTGVPFFDAVFSELNCEVKWSITEGEYVRPVCEVATVTGKVSVINRVL